MVSRSIQRRAASSTSAGPHEPNRAGGEPTHSTLSDLPTTGRGQGGDIGSSSAKRHARRSGRRSKGSGRGVAAIGTATLRSSTARCAQSYAVTTSTLGCVETRAPWLECSTAYGVLGGTGCTDAVAEKRTIAVAESQDHPRRLIAGGVAKLCIRTGVALLITEEPDDRIGHVRICGGDGSAMAVSTRTGRVVTAASMRRHESRRGAKVTGGADLEGVEPRKFWLVSADGFVPPVGNNSCRALASGTDTPRGPRPCRA
jgi:hypothetical protein